MFMEAAILLIVQLISSRYRQQLKKSKERLETEPAEQFLVGYAAAHSLPPDPFLFQPFLQYI